MGTISRVGKEMDSQKENNPGGYPSRLSAHDKQSIVQQINSGKLDNAVQAANFIHDGGKGQTLKEPSSTFQIDTNNVT